MGRSSTVQPLGDQEPVRQIVRAERECVDAAVRLPVRPAAPEVRFETCGSLCPAVILIIGIPG
jgi:hypothetical protein